MCLFFSHLALKLACNSVYIDVPSTVSLSLECHSAKQLKRDYLRMRGGEGVGVWGRFEDMKVKGEDT
jgi:hypothetical protein